MNLGTIIDALYESEINCSIVSCCDAGIAAKLGDDQNGYVAERQCRTTHEAAEFLAEAAREHYPNSKYVLGARR